MQVVSKFRILSRHLAGGTEVKYEKPQSRMRSSADIRTRHNSKYINEALWLEPARSVSCVNSTSGVVAYAAMLAHHWWN
jgi:hypothetical protein